MSGDQGKPPAEEDLPGPPEEQSGRLAQPVDAEQPPRLPFPVVGIGASAGGLEAVSEFLGAMRPDSGMAFVLVQHLQPDRASLMAEILARRTAMPVLQADDGMEVVPNHVYVIRPDRILTIREGHLHLGKRLGSPRAANRPVDDFFRSLAEEQRERAICVVMSGMGSNGTAGAQVIKAVGGLCIAQDPESAQFPSMPRHVIDAGYADYILRPTDLPEVLLSYAGHPYARGGREADARELLSREDQSLREILAVLRTRTRQDFSGYKKPTLLRRVQRRMGLTRTLAIADYARLLRQSPSEVTALADDLLIHVTGFFRDAEAWETLRRLVIAPLVEAREHGSSIRAWVTACSSGEEAYSLAMVLLEEAERVGKVFDIKVFATDLAQRSLAHARAGIYAGGIESEIPPERLKRFFSKEDEVYRVRSELRDRVVFAPQNILQDPPFSRLDIATCRNMLIYLEPEVQQRVLALLHFGLREGGALFLGNTEAINGAEVLFEPIDKRARIFRRLGPTRHGLIDFPLPHALAGREDGGAGASLPRAQPRRREGEAASIAQLTRRTLLESHTPAAVTVDRDFRIIYYHGDTRPFLQQPSGEPTRDMMLLARDGVRGAARLALHRAAALNAKVVVTDGWADVDPGHRVRVAVTASPIVEGPSDETPARAHFFVVSFEERGDLAAAIGEDGDQAEGIPEETRRLRSELQSTIEELQTSNEELKASNEEVMSINEELQSANEELETSKEEMQSLNEELTTVNAQLRAKMEEHQAASSDLMSLLASTDIAVLFLDTGFRIRRYTPAVRDLLDLIPADLGRPLTALARRFEDPQLDEDANTVLERLVPIEREVTGLDGRHFLRRVLPYRTTDNRIEGVVVTFVDVTSRKRAEEARRSSEERLRALLAATSYAVYRMSPDWSEMRQLDGQGFLLDTRAPNRAWVDEYILPEDQPQVLAAIREAIRAKGLFELEHRVRRADGSSGWTHSRAVPLLGVGGEIEEWFGAASDITLRKEIEEALRERTAWLRGQHEALEAALNGQPLEAALGTLVRTAVEALGEGIRAAFYLVNEEGGSLRHVVGMPAAYVEAVEGSRGGPESLATQTGLPVLTADVMVDPRWEPWRSMAERFDYRGCWSFPIHTAAGRFVGTFAVYSRQPREAAARDMELASLLTHTASILLARHAESVARKQAEQALHESKERLRLVLEAARMGIWTWDADADAQARDGYLNRLLGLEATASMQPLAEFLEHVHPEDRALVSSAFADSIEHGRPLEIEFRIIRPDGTVRWLRDQGDILRQVGGGTPLMAGACVDISDLKEAEAALRDGEERLRLILTSAVDYAILTLGPDRTVTSWSPGALATFGYAEEEIVGRSADMVFTPEDRAGGVPEEEARTALREGRAADERWHIRKDGTRFFASGVLNPLGDGGSLGFVKVLRDLTDRKRMEDALVEARAQLEARVRERTAELLRVHEVQSDLLRRLVTVQEDERRRVSRELHDGLGQELTALILGLKALERDLAEGSPARERLREVETIVGQIGREAHDLAVELRPTALDDIGLGPALADYVARWSERTGIAADLQSPGLEGGRMPPDVETTVYRVVQEALNNAAKHSGASRVSVIVERRPGELTALVEDDGRGFDPAQATPDQPHAGRKSLGLLGMKERATLLGGSFLVESADHQGEPTGTIVRIRIPLLFAEEKSYE